MLQVGATGIEEEEEEEEDWRRITLICHQLQFHFNNIKHFVAV
jgi:hypothetical protein